VELALAGALIRLWFVARHKGNAPPWTLALGVILIAASAAILAPAPQKPGAAVPFAEVKRIMDARCVSCHAEKPAFQGLPEAPKGVKLDSDERIRVQAAQIKATVRSGAMPPGNLTGLTVDERMLIERWSP